MPNYDHIEDNLHSEVSVTQFRRNMSAYIATVRFGRDVVCIRRKGRDPVYLISQEDFVNIGRFRKSRRYPSQAATTQRTPRVFWRRLFRRRPVKVPEMDEPQPSLSERIDRASEAVERATQAPD